MNYHAEQIMELLNDKCLKHFGCYSSEATIRQTYKVTCLVIRDILIKQRKEFTQKVAREQAKQVYYMSMEFLVGTSLRNNLYNLGLEQTFSNALKSLNVDVQELYAIEPDAGLGNGGLGRLASCYMDSMTAQDIPVTGFSIRYEFGIFKQRIIDGWQVEFPDDWLDKGDSWLIPREDEMYEVRFGGTVEHYEENGRLKINHQSYSPVMAIPYDMMISGYSSKATNELVLWSAKSPHKLDLSAFSRGEYVKSLEQNTMAEVITKVLYPADEHMEGKILRVKQQYLLVSASLQGILKQHLKQYGTLANLSDKVAIHINDTHPALCVPEMMRLLVDNHDFDWDSAWKITGDTLAYTNHTVMSEALERWPENMFRNQLPRVYQIVCEINRRLVDELYSIYPGDIAKVDNMAIIANGQVSMVNMCLAACHKVNGVSKLHSEILKTGLFLDYYKVYPEKFTNVTNGIAYRRWLCQSNPGLTKLLQELIGDGFMKDAHQLQELMRYHNDTSVLARLQEVKRQNKLVLCDYISKVNGIHVDPDSIFDVQIKRLHEYKRQLLNVMHILYLYNQIKSNPNAYFVPRTFLFGAKASSGYLRAKQIIRLITSISKMINNDPIARDKINVVFIEDYKVSLAEMIIPASEISEQISIAGKEASGTGNMKLMLNGAVTIGTLDGANVEILEQVGHDNMFLFGMTASEVEDLWRRGYDPRQYYNNNRELKAVIDMLSCDICGTRFDDLVKSLLTNSFGTADAYMTLADFDSYVQAQKQVSKIYMDKQKFMNMSLVNIAHAGLFSADRSVSQYANQIWGVNAIK